MTTALFDLTGKTALVTGSSRGIGLALAGGLQAAGCHVVLNGRDGSALDRAADELRARSTSTTAASPGGRISTAAFDVTGSGEVARGIARAEEAAGPIEILVNNAGMQRRAPLLEFSETDWRSLLETNLTSAFLVGREVARGMTARGHGKIINICSLQSELARPGIAAYAATKGGLKMLTKGMCADLAISGVQVNGIGPGYFATELTAPLVQDTEFSSWVRGRTPAGRWGEVGDLVGPLLFLASPASDFVNGQILYVDGGMSSVL